MAYAYSGETPVDYALCRYGDSRLLFRGPFRTLRDGYCVALGGTETYGRGVTDPWPAILERSLGRMVVNLGLPNAGPDVYLRDPVAQSIAMKAAIAFLQVPGAINLSNKFYSVHPRRNDRVLRVAADLRRLYPGLDFVEFNFTNHLVSRLRAIDAERFSAVQDELRRVWITRMSELLARLPVQTALVWIAGTPVPDVGTLGWPPTPSLVDRAMMAAVAKDRPLVEVVLAASERTAEELVEPAALHLRIARNLASYAAALEKQTGARKRPQ